MLWPVDSWLPLASPLGSGHGPGFPTLTAAVPSSRRPTSWEGAHTAYHDNRVIWANAIQSNDSTSVTGRGGGDYAIKLTSLPSAAAPRGQVVPQDELGANVGGHVQHIGRRCRDEPNQICCVGG
jgi:hypothetical protein